MPPSSFLTKSRTCLSHLRDSGDSKGTFYDKKRK
jgi:hypothetical protein